MSPFAKSFYGQNAITACIRGNQLELFEYLLKDIDQLRTCLGPPPSPKYLFHNPEDKAHFIKSMAGHDHRGNNYCHFIFEKKHLDSRYKFL